MKLLVAAAAACAMLSANPAMSLSISEGQTTTPPKLDREFRGVWVATVSNIDWPTSRTQSTEAQKKDLVKILDQCVKDNLNAVVLQVRPACDAIYKSDLEPWSEYLTGKQGKAPEPFYDPLEFAVEEAHKRGLEMHVWFNPYRALHPSAKSPVADNHISKTQPEIVKQYGKHLWMDPTDQRTIDHTIAVIKDVIKRYDIDGIHVDDYFYPYEELDKNKKPISFPDDQNWEKYKAAGGTMKRDDWRRYWVDKFVQSMYKAAKETKATVKVGISPFGIWKPGYPAQIKGFSQYDKLYADAKLWLNKGWVDYWTPQLYWNVSNPDQSFPVLLKWWTEENTKQRHIWPGQYTSRISTRESTEPLENRWSAKEISNQIKWMRLTPGASGTVHFSMAAFMKNVGKINEELTTPTGVYHEPAVVPASPWLDSRKPRKPLITATPKPDAKAIVLEWKPAEGDKDIRFWAVQVNKGGKWTTKVVGPDETRLIVSTVDETTPTQAVAISALNRAQNQGPVATIVFKSDKDEPAKSEKPVTRRARRPTTDQQ
ncbi:MAG: family 10 glycosylhydrolase [Candidatus Sumerlaeaceae bacterium]|nr:family 10 glycosylhydrolase [Candidatus Sumerlaeaceae bacterium]